MMRFGRAQRETSAVLGEESGPAEHTRRQRAHSEVIGKNGSAQETRRSVGLFSSSTNNGSSGGEGRLSSRNLMGKQKDDGDDQTITDSVAGKKSDKAVLKRYKSDQAALKGISAGVRSASRMRSEEGEEGKKSKASKSGKPALRKTLSATSFGGSSSQKMDGLSSGKTKEAEKTKEDDCYKPVEKVNWGLGHYYHGDAQSWRVGANAAKTPKTEGVNAGKKADWDHVGPKNERDDDGSSSSSSSSSSSNSDDDDDDKPKKDKDDKQKLKPKEAKEQKKDKESPRKSTPKVSAKKPKESSSKADEVPPGSSDKEKDEPKEEIRKEETKELSIEELKEQMKEKMREEMKQKMKEEMARKELEEQLRKELEEEVKRELREELRAEVEKEVKQELEASSHAEPDQDTSFSQLTRNRDDGFGDFGATDATPPAPQTQSSTPEESPGKGTSSKSKPNPRRRASISNTPSFDENTKIEKTGSDDSCDEGMLGVLNNAAASTKSKQSSAESVSDNGSNTRRMKRRSSLSDASPLPPASPSSQPLSPVRRIGKGLLGRAFKSDDHTEKEPTINLEELDEVPPNTPGHDLFAYFLPEQEPVVYVQLSDESEDKDKKKDKKEPVIEYPELNIHLASRNTELALKPKQLQHEPYRPVGPLRDSLTSGLVVF